MKIAIVTAPVEEVWKAWTTTEGIKTFFAPDARSRRAPAAPSRSTSIPTRSPGMKGADDMVVLAVQENRMLSFTWNAPPHLPEVRAPAHERHRALQRAGAEDPTDVRLTHSGWGDGGQWDQAYDYFDTAPGAACWPTCEKRFVEGPIDWSAWLKQMKAYQDAEDAKAAAGKKP